MSKKYINVQLEVDFYDDENEGQVVQSVLPISAEINNFSKEELRDVNSYLRHADDASFELMWDLRALISDAVRE